LYKPIAPRLLDGKEPHRPEDPEFALRFLQPGRAFPPRLTPSAVATACLACSAFADPIPLPTLVPPQPCSGGIVEIPLRGTAIPADPSNLPNPLPSFEERFRAEAANEASPQRPTSGGGPFGFLSADWQSQNLLGDMGGLRPALAKYGATLSILENVETFGNLTGGVRPGFETNGLTTATLQVDARKAFGLTGGLFNVSGLQIWGGDLSADNLLVIQTASDISAPVGVRLWELWYQQKFGDRFGLKIGAQSLDEEFAISPSSYFFINSASGWPALAAADLPGGGPAYPLAALGARGRAQLMDNVTLLAGLFNGSPIPKNSPNNPRSNPYGVSFPVDTGLLAIAELQFMFLGTRGSAKAHDQSSLPGVYKIGLWWDSGTFDDQHYDTMGVPLASPASDGIPAIHHGDFAIYGVADQMIWRATDDTSRTLNVFVRPMFAPFEDREFVSFSLDAGLNLKSPLPGRDNDAFGVEIGVARASSGASGYDRNLNAYNFPAHTPVRNAETFLEATYQAQVTPWWQIQPDVQYFVNPGAGIANPSDPTQKVKNELVIGLRTNVTF
jgi:porin